MAPDGVESSPCCCVVSWAGLLELVLLALLLLVVTDLVVLLVRVLLSLCLFPSSPVSLTS